MLSKAVQREADGAALLTRKRKLLPVLVDPVRRHSEDQSGLFYIDEAIRFFDDPQRRQWLAWRGLVVRHLSDQHADRVTDELGELLRRERLDARSQLIQQRSAAR